MPGAFVSSTSPPPRQPSQPYADPYSSTSNNAYGTGAAAGTHSASAAAYGGVDYGAYGNQDPYYSDATTANNANTTGAVGYATTGGSAYQSPTATGVAATSQPERSYTLGGGGYGGNVVPDSTTSKTAYGAPGLSTSPPPMPTANVHDYNNYASSSAYPGTSQVGGGGGQGSTGSSYEDAPPGYEASGPSNVHVPAWGSKGGVS